MQPELVFKLANLAPLPIWIAWIAAPRSEISRYFARAVWPFVLLGVLYVVTLVAGVAQANASDAQGGFSTLQGVMAGFDQPWITVAGWVHYLCFDLFVARWILNDAPEAGPRLTPILLLTLFAGPAGLLVYLGLRRTLGGVES